VPLYLGLILTATGACWLAGDVALRKGSWAGATALFLLGPLAYVFTAGLLSRIHGGRVIAGRMSLDTGISSYFHRRLYGLCWTAVYYSGPVYYGVLSLPWLKKAVFRLFGYRGSMNFTIYPDTWVRDLPLLDFGDGAYLANKATIGSNMIFIRNGRKEIEVGKIAIGAHSMVGHLAMIGPGTEIGDNVQVGVGCGIGRRVKIGKNVVIGDVTVCDHGSKLDEGVQVPTRCYIGMRRHVTLDDGLRAGEVILRRERHNRIDVALEGA
jgi:hypothetical protein